MRNKGLIVDSQCYTVSFWMYFADPDSDCGESGNDIKAMHVVKYYERKGSCEAASLWKAILETFVFAIYLPQYFTLMFFFPPHINLISGTNTLSSLRREVLEVSLVWLRLLAAISQQLLNDK